MTDTQAVLEQIARKLDELAKVAGSKASAEAEKAIWASLRATAVTYAHAAQIVREGGAA